MDIKNNVTVILKELMQHAEKINCGQLEQFANEIAAANRIFAAGSGRSGLAMRAFAMRLMHLGKDVHMLGDVTTPRARAGDLLLIGSGSGETKSLVAAAEKAKSCGMRVALNTIDKTSTLAKLADVIIVLPGASPKVQNDTEKTASLQPMGSSFEQLSLLVYDAVILALMQKLGKTDGDMFARHSNME